MLSCFSLRGSSFLGPLTIEGDFPCIPDLRRTRTDHHVDLDTLDCTLARSPAWPKFSWLSLVADDPEDAGRLRRLKELAEANRDHAAALRFAAYENRASRWTDNRTDKRKILAPALDLLYSALSNYGQSILRPFLGLVGLTFLSATLLWLLSGCQTVARLWDAFLLSLANALAFLPQSRSIRHDAEVALFGADPGFMIDVTMMVQAMASFAFVFLIGLGLRNRFRL